MDQSPREWEQARYWQQHADVLKAGGTEAAGDDEPPPARRPGRAGALTLVRVVALTVVLIAVIAAVRPSRRSAPPPSADAPISDTTGGPLEPVPGSAPPDTSAGATPSVTRAEQSAPGKPSPKPSATRPTPTGAQPTPARSKAASPTPTAVPVIAPAAGMVVRAVSWASGDSVGVSQGSTADGASIVSSRNTTAPAQQWRLTAAGKGCFFLINVRSGKALDNPDGSSVDGAQMHQWTAVAGNVNQIWCFHQVGRGLYAIRNLAGGTLLDLRDGGRADGTAIQQWGADPEAPNVNQTWQLLRVT